MTRLAGVAKFLLLLLWTDGRQVRAQQTHTHTGKTKLDTCTECSLKIWVSTLNNRFLLNSAVGLDSGSLWLIFFLVMGNIKWAAQVSVCRQRRCVVDMQPGYCVTAAGFHGYSCPKQYRAATLFRSHGVAMFTFSHFICNKMIFKKRCMTVILRSLEVSVRSYSRPPSTLPLSVSSLTGLASWHGHQIPLTQSGWWIISGKLTDPPERRFWWGNKTKRQKLLVHDMESVPLKACWIFQSFFIHNIFLGIKRLCSFSNRSAFILKAVNT